jgi:hypothetical protein
MGPYTIVLNTSGNGSYMLQNSPNNDPNFTAALAAGYRLAAVDPINLYNSQPYQYVLITLEYVPANDPQAEQIQVNLPNPLPVKVANTSAIQVDIL